MGQKIKPISLRLGINRTWDSRWFADKGYADLLNEDLNIRRFIHKELKQAAISRIIIERPTKKVNITIYTARPGLIIGKKGADIESFRMKLSNLVSKEISLNLVELRKPELDARLTAENIATQIEHRASYRRAMKRAIQSAMRLGAQGIRIICSGRLGGTDIARAEQYREGRVPLHTLRADVDYGSASAHTTYGVCGIKVWIFKGEILAHDTSAQEKNLKDQQSLGRILN